MAVHGLSLVAVSRGIVVRGHLLMQDTGSRVHGFSSHTQAQSPPVMWELPGPGIEPISPALAGEFLATGPPGKSSNFFFFSIPSPSSASATNYSPFCLSPHNCDPEVVLQTCPKYQALPFITETLSPSAVHSSCTRRANRSQPTCQLQQWQPELLGWKKKN